MLIGDHIPFILVGKYLRSSGMAAMIWILSKRDETEYENARLLEEFSSRGIDAILVNPKKFGVLLDWRTNENVTYDGAHKTPSAILVRTGSGTDYNTFAMLKDFEHHKIPVINSGASTILAKDKYLSGQALSCNQVPTPLTMMIKHPVKTATVKRDFGFPLVLKVNTGSYGLGVHLVRTEEDFTSLIQLIETIAPSCQILIQKFVDSKIGTDLRVWVIDGKVIAAMQRKASKGEFRANIMTGGTGISYPLDDKIIDIASRAAKAIGLEIAGVDLLFDGDGYTVCEVNSSPGFKGFESFCEINIAKLIVDHFTKTDLV